MATIKYIQFAVSHFLACLHMENNFVKSMWDLWKTLLLLFEHFYYCGEPTQQGTPKKITITLLPIYKMTSSNECEIGVFLNVNLRSLGGLSGSK